MPGIPRAAEPRFMSVDPDRAGVTPERVDAGQDLDQGRLARPVLAAEGVDLACAHVEMDVLERLDPAEMLGDAPRLQPRRVFAGPAHCRSSARWNPSRMTVASRLSRSTTTTGSRMLGTSLTPLG